jgi:branched-chain amino acid transport system permease protein
MMVFIGVILSSVGIAIPWVFPDYWLHVTIIALYYVILASSWNLIAGYTGQITFAHSAFAALGAYTSALITNAGIGLSPWITLPLVVIISGGVGGLLGLFCLRMGGIYLSLASLAFSEAVRMVLTNEDQWTRGTMGLQVISFFGEYSKIWSYYLFLAATALVLLVLCRIIHSDLGLRFRAVLNDEVAAASYGVPVTQIRVLAFAISSAIAGLGGALYAHYVLLITPDLGSLDQMFLVLAMSVIGGLGTFWGPVAGAILLQVLTESLRPVGQYHLLVFAVLALVAVKIAPSGILGRSKQ